MAISFSTVPDLLFSLKQGRPIILMDNEDRENEGDFVVAADCVTCDVLHMFSVLGRGLICLVITEEIAHRCHIPLMVPYSRMPPGRSTAFTMTIEAAAGIQTGIPFRERIHTIHTVISPTATAADIVQPGHIQPLIARPGGVWVRDGHTEASSDLVRLAGYPSASSLIVEVIRDDGYAARSDDLFQLAEAQGLSVGSVKDTFVYRVERECFLKEEATFSLRFPLGCLEVKPFRDIYSGAASWACAASFDALSHHEAITLHIFVAPSLRDLSLDATPSLLSCCEQACRSSSHLLLFLQVESVEGLDVSLQKMSGEMFWAGLSVQLLRLLSIHTVIYQGPLSEALSAYACLTLL